MSRDDIIRLREECDEWAEDHLQCKGEYHPDFHTVSDERFAAQVALAEREACAKVCEELARQLAKEGVEPVYPGDAYAAAIRARGNT
jgi:hypothetical protein